MSVSTVYVAMGDSTGVGFGVSRGEGYVSRVHARMRDADPATRLVNLAVNGATSVDVRESQLERALRERPSVCSIVVGGNDLFRGIEPRRFTRNLRAMAERLDLIHTRVVIGTVPNVSHAPAARLAERFLGISRAGIEARLVSYNEGVRRVAMDHGYTLVDLFDVSLAEHPEYFGSDGFHPSSEGHAAMAERMWPSFAGLVARDSSAST